MATMVCVHVAPASAAEALRAVGACREGAPHGLWQLVGANGRPRALGAFAKGKRTGSFIFWNAAGVRIAHVPYDEDERNGTLAMWYDEPSRDGGSLQRLEAKYVHDAPDGTITTWYRDGRVRGEYRYVAGSLVDAAAWDARGRPLAPDAARAQAEADAKADARRYAALDALVDRHLPHCFAVTPKPR